MAKFLSVVSNSLPVIGAGCAPCPTTGADFLEGVVGAADFF